jgi:hypothetical protein
MDPPSRSKGLCIVPVRSIRGKPSTRCSHVHTKRTLWRAGEREADSLLDSDFVLQLMYRGLAVATQRARSLDRVASGGVVDLWSGKSERAD